MSTITKAITGAHTIGSLTVSTSLAANTETYDLGDDSDCSPPCAAGVFSVGSLPVEFSARSRIVIGTTVRLMTRPPSAIGMALSPPEQIAEHSWTHERHRRRGGCERCECAHAHLHAKNDTGEQKHHTIESNDARAQGDHQWDVLTKCGA